MASADSLASPRQRRLRRTTPLARPARECRPQSSRRLVSDTKANAAEPARANWTSSGNFIHAPTIEYISPLETARADVREPVSLRQPHPPRSLAIAIRTSPKAVPKFPQAV